MHLIVTLADKPSRPTPTSASTSIRSTIRPLDRSVSEKPSRTRLPRPTWLQFLKRQGPTTARVFRRRRGSTAGGAGWRAHFTVDAAPVPTAQQDVGSCAAADRPAAGAGWVAARLVNSPGSCTTSYSSGSRSSPPDRHSFQRPRRSMARARSGAVRRMLGERLVAPRGVGAGQQPGQAAAVHGRRRGSRAGGRSAMVAATSTQGHALRHPPARRRRGPASGSAAGRARTARRSSSCATGRARRASRRGRWCGSPWCRPCQAVLVERVQEPAQLVVGVAHQPVVGRPRTTDLRVGVAMEAERGAAAGAPPGGSASRCPAGRSGRSAWCGEVLREERLRHHRTGSAARSGPTHSANGTRGAVPCARAAQVRERRIDRLVVGVDLRAAARSGGQGWPASSSAAGLPLFVRTGRHARRRCAPPPGHGSRAPPARRRPRQKIGVLQLAVQVARQLLLEAVQVIVTRPGASCRTAPRRSRRRRAGAAKVSASAASGVALSQPRQRWVYCPVRNESRDGTHSGLLQYARRRRSPLPPPAGPSPA